MKQIDYKKKFQKQFQKLTESQKEYFFVRLKEFLTDSSLPHLRYHSLRWRFLWYKSINITWDIRAICKEEWDTLIIFYMIWTHSELY